MQNEKLNPITCELQVGDVCELLKNSCTGIIKFGETCKIDRIGDSYFVIENDVYYKDVAFREDLRLISRNGKAIEESEKKFFANVYDNGNGRFLSHDYDSFEEAYENREDISTYIETVEIVRHKKPEPKIDFGKAGLIMTDGEIVVVTTGAEADNYFEASCLLQSKDFGGFPYRKNKDWRDITAEAMPIIEQLKQLMNGK